MPCCINLCGGRPHGAAPTVMPPTNDTLRRGWCPHRPADGGYFAPGRGTFHGWKVPKDPRVVVLTKSAALRTPRCGHPSLRSLARPLPTTTTTLGRGWVPGGSAPYDFRTQSARLEKGLNLFGAGVNLGPFPPPPAAARAGQIRRPLFSTLRLSCALPFRLRLLRSSHHVGPDAPIGPRKR